MWMKTCFHSHFYANFHASITLVFLIGFSWIFHQNIEQTNWEWYTPYREVFAHFLIGKGPLFSSKSGQKISLHLQVWYKGLHCTILLYQAVSNDVQGPSHLDQTSILFQRFGEFEAFLERISASIDPLLDNPPLHLPTAIYGTFLEKLGSLSGYSSLAKACKYTHRSRWENN